MVKIAISLIILISNFIYRLFFLKSNDVSSLTLMRLIFVIFDFHIK